MKKIFYGFAVLATMVLAGCTSEEVVSTAGNQELGDEVTINFSSGNQAITRSAVTGADAAALLGNTFRVYGTQRSGSVDVPVFDNFVVNYEGESSIGKDATNTRGWSYFGFTSKGLAPATQSVKYWNLTVPQYDFVAFAGIDDDIRVASTTSNTFAVDQTNKDKIFVSDRVTAKYQASATGKTANAQYGKTVTITFKRLAARIRLGIYETVPGYAVKDVKFYYDDNYLSPAGTSTKTVAGLRGKFPVSGNVTITYDENNYVVSDFEGTDVANNFQFGELDYTTAASSLLSGGFLKADGTVGATGDAAFLSNTSADPTFAKSTAVLDGETVNNSTWQTIIPYASNSVNLVLRVDFTLVSLDGVGAPIEVKGASAVVPASYAQWKSNYAYTYIFKISDKTNGTTGTVDPNPVDPDNPNPNPEPGVDQGIYPITFDATVSSVTDYNEETITGVTSLGGDAITTYAEGSDVTNNNEYKVGEKITAASISYGQWSVAYSTTEPSEATITTKDTYTYTILAGIPGEGQTINDVAVTSAQFTADKVGFYIVRLQYLPIGLADVPGNYVYIYKVVKVVE